MEWNEYLKTLIKEKNKTQRELAYAGKVTDQHLSRLIAGNGLPSNELLQNIITYLNLSQSEQNALLQLIAKEKFKKNPLLLSTISSNMQKSPVKEVKLFAWKRLKKNLQNEESGGTVYTTSMQTDIYATQPPTGETLIIDPHRTPQSGNIAVIYNNETETPQVGKYQQISGIDIITTADGETIQISIPWELMGVVIKKEIDCL